MKKAVLYLNQFFGQIGGEDQADYSPEVNEELIGPAMLLNQLLENAEVTHTVICGDNYMGSNEEEAIETILEELEGVDFDIFFAGPAFQAGRYGNACGAICKAVKEEFDVPVISSMNKENPGVDMYKKDVIIFPGGHSAAKMKDNMQDMAEYGDKLLSDEQEVGSAEEEGYYIRGIRHQVWLEDGTPAADRAIDMLLKKVNGEEFVSELPMPDMDRVEIADPVDLSDAKIALATSGGIVPVDNPDKIQSASATRWGRYDISDLDSLPNREAGEYKTIHAGYDPAAADSDPNRVVPLDALREYEKEGKIGKIDDYFYTTVGTGTTEAEASRMGQEMVECMQEDGVDAVILTST
ncbi:glycine reductase [Sporohalobacter salinus]|nr:glycine reductase [Sporohalobacter salinus]